MAGNPDKTDTVALMRKRGSILPSRLATYRTPLRRMGKIWHEADYNEEEHF